MNKFKIVPNYPKSPYKTFLASGTNKMQNTFLNYIIKNKVVLIFWKVSWIREIL